MTIQEKICNGEPKTSEQKACPHPYQVRWQSNVLLLIPSLMTQVCMPLIY
ncbi:hypothetical protein VCRA2128O106_520011 [Vibrio crassostreae]|nr:hypothetical protein VCRA2126O86_120006 [Vibrio crassostreae]CAK2596364.1 hypothetical protein VCRA2127O91_120006 [Vibrio crassostreae]CAK3013081.1 hypothetical protein VCRA2128O106_520011 [Vibrio crassostreae]CAK3151867.1 hypothetical protein VCRA2128O105_140006 [Vibrio crassostreae]CAK3666872.1 hypothetical protein VCRA2128O108_510006 [Vibrio crassostreae]